MYIIFHFYILICLFSNRFSLSWCILMLTIIPSYCSWIILHYIVLKKFLHQVLSLIAVMIVFIYTSSSCIVAFHLYLSMCLFLVDLLALVFMSVLFAEASQAMRAVTFPFGICFFHQQSNSIWLITYARVATRVFLSMSCISC